MGAPLHLQTHGCKPFSRNARLSFRHTYPDATRCVFVRLDRPKTSAQPGSAGSWPSVAGSLGSVTESQDVTAEVSLDQPGKVHWYEKPCEGWTNINTQEALQAALTETRGKMVVIDFYAGWCAVCKGAYPTLCKLLVLNPKLKEKFNFYKANLECDAVTQLIKANNVRGIPYVLVFSPEGKVIIGFGASFKKMDAVKRNLEKIGSDTLHDYVLDPNGFVINR